MKLYELTNDFSDLFSQLDDIIENEELTADEREVLSEAWFDTLEMLEAEFEDKAESIAVFVKELAAEADTLKKEENALAARRKSREKTIERLKSYLLRNMEQISLNKIDKPKARISLRNNAESVQIENDTEFINWAMNNREDLLRYKDPEISKSAVKQALNDGEEIPGASLVRTKSVLIK